MLVDSSKSTPTAEAGWTPTPQSTSTADVDAIIDACASDLIEKERTANAGQIGDALAVDVRGAGDQEITTFDSSGQPNTPVSIRQLFECSAPSLDQPATGTQPDQ